jgi:hypothetical protein
MFQIEYKLMDKEKQIQAALKIINRKGLDQAYLSDMRESLAELKSEWEDLRRRAEKILRAQRWQELLRGKI